MIFYQNHAHVFAIKRMKYVGAAFDTGWQLRTVGQPEARKGELLGPLENSFLDDNIKNKYILYV